MTHKQDYLRIVIPIDPMGAPRQTRSDKWRPRDCVIRYRYYRDIIRSHIDPVNFPDNFFVRFTIRMPASWSQKKRSSMLGQPHRQKPDIDNMAKGLIDSIFRDEDDAHVWRIFAEKIWGESGLIEILPIPSQYIVHIETNHP